jgi:ABC-type transporter Mla subunit MlaD
MTAEDYKGLAEKAGRAAESAEDIARGAEKEAPDFAARLRNQAKQLRKYSPDTRPLWVLPSY